MKLQSIFSHAFAHYGRILSGFDVHDFLAVMRKTTEKPQQGVTYVPSYTPLEQHAIIDVLTDSVYGGMPIQIGYCNGTNTKLNGLEYHRNSEINITADEIVLLVAKQQDLQEGCLHTSQVEAFRAPAGVAIELYATTLHYAPCDGIKNKGFRVAVVLPRGTNTQKPEAGEIRGEDTLLWAKNKWLIAHEDTQEAEQGAFVGLIGKNLDIVTDL